MQQDDNGLPYFDPDSIEQVLEEVSKLKTSNEGSMSAYELLEAAFDSNGALKDMFTWNDKAAAQYWRELQSLQLLEMADLKPQETEEEKDIYELMFSSSGSKEK